MAKRNAQGAGSLRQRADGRWEARYTAGRDPGTGKQIQKSLYGATQGEVLEKLKAIHADMQSGTYVEPSKLTVAQWLDTWHKEYTGHLKPRTKTLYKGQLERIKTALGAAKLQRLKPHQVQAFYNALQSGPDPLAPKSIKNLHGLLHKAMQQAVEVGYLKQNPTQGCKLPRAERPQITPLDDDQMAAFMAAIKGHRFEAFYTVVLFTGIRQGEALGLTWDCINFSQGTIRVYRQLQRHEGAHQFMPLKNDKARTITPAGFIMQLLKNHKRAQIEQQLRVGPVWSNPDNLVFTNEAGGHYVRETVFKDFKQIVAALGQPKVRFHDMRHSYAVASLRAGDDVRTVQENLGHYTAAFTLDTYAHATEQMKRESAERMDAFISRIQGKA